MTIPRLLTAMITPYDDKLQVDYARAAELADYLANNGSEGIVVSGTTGESPVLTDEEKLKLFAAVKGKLGKRIPVWAGTGSNDTQHSLELSKEAEKLGVDGVMLVCPYYSKPSQEGLYQHFRKIAGAISLPVMLYNVPGRTGINLLPETVTRLAKIENIVAIKEASGSMDQVSTLMTLLPEEMTVYSGDDSLTLPMMALGARGVVSIASHLVGKEILAMIDAFGNGEVKRAGDLHKQLFPIFKGLFITTNPVPLKEVLNQLGQNVGGLRLPLVEANETEKIFIQELLINAKLLPQA
ncbi:MAG: 4-hydroxy-tetrahydrodipicolinate synthase [Syntrophomonadaceae bacterium]|nr:4-hydroxy-tetrahydrodipicolinate synthase [Syntrophomonadaceae bacterium]MDD3271086.1 4-hydroxy-tetrahydrodipicolinate synthase [Syntrophomonadaceae bacterium]MDD3897374.1 4-hydroxy-tetrahydrodipicolinate synthase [Syntrophomonadaceae bacterium]MDD4562153.1 4-hydroxy-tetrahydrodipicolinate synthase [Syntrophomonadaceae bacterium]